MTCHPSFLLRIGGWRFFNIFNSKLEKCAAVNKKFIFRRLHKRQFFVPINLSNKNMQIVKLYSTYQLSAVDIVTILLCSIFSSFLIFFNFFCSAVFAVNKLSNAMIPSSVIFQNFIKNPLVLRSFYW